MEKMEEANRNDLRCFCGKLLVRVLPDGSLELKCARCRRTMIIRYLKDKQGVLRPAITNPAPSCNQGAGGERA